MANTRQDIVDHFKSQVDNVNGLNVYEWQVTPLMEAKLPAAIVRDTEGAMPTDKEMARRHHYLTIEVDLAASSSTSPSTVRELMASVLSAIGADKTLGGHAYDTTPLSATLMVSEGDQRVCGAQMVFQVKYITSLWAI